MSEDSNIFTQNDIKLFCFELKSKFRAGIRTPVNILYIFMTLIGVGWASWAIPVFNKSSITPETIGIYVIGFLISVGLDALLVWKKTGDDNGYEQAISVLIIIASFVLIIIASILSLKSFSAESTIESEGSWKFGAYVFLPFILILAILMSLVLTGFDTRQLPIGSLDISENSISNRG